MSFCLWRICPLSIILGGFDDHLLGEQLQSFHDKLVEWMTCKVVRKQAIKWARISVYEGEFSWKNTYPRKWRKDLQNNSETSPDNCSRSDSRNWPPRTLTVKTSRDEIRNSEIRRRAIDDVIKIKKKKKKWYEHIT